MVEGKGFVGHVSNNRALLQHTRVQNAAERGSPRNQAQPSFCRCPELSLKVVDERERRRTLLGKLNTTPQRPGATRGERYATCAEAYHCEDGNTGGAPGRGDAR